MDSKVAAALLLLLKKKKKPRNSIRPINKKRKQFGFYVTTFIPMKSNNPEQFFLYTRMTVPLFEVLLMKTSHLLETTSNTEFLSPEHRLAITLHYLSQGVSMQNVAWSFHVDLTTVREIIKETCSVIIEVLFKEYVTHPTTALEWLKIVNKFEEKWHLIHCVGALDGKNINYQPSENTDTFNFKKLLTITLMAACDADYCFTLIDTGTYGSQSNFRESKFKQALNPNVLQIPEASYIPNSNLSLLPYFFVADETFPFKIYIMRPYAGTNLSAQQRVYNYRLSRARSSIENTFGILVARWRILRTTIYADVNMVDLIIKACVCLHNFIKKNEDMSNGSKVYCPFGFVDTDDCESGMWRQEITPLPSVGRLSANNATKDLYTLRDQLASYFVSPAGQLSWQNDKI